MHQPVEKASLFTIKLRLVSNFFSYLYAKTEHGWRYTVRSEDDAFHQGLVVGKV